MLKRVKKLLKNRNRQKIILAVLIACAISIVFSKGTPYDKDCEELTYPKTSATPIYVDDSRSNYNWAKLKSLGGCTGSGIRGDPYVIENEIIDGSGWKNGIWIENSQAYFTIIDCKLTNCGQNWMDGGIKLVSVQNGVIMNNNCTDNTGSGIYLQASRFIELIGNEASYNQECGIFLSKCSDNILSNNDVRDNIETRNGRAGIKLAYGKNNQIVENEVSNQWIGIDISGDAPPTTRNNISQNSVSNCGRYGILFDEAHNNSITDNVVTNCNAGIYLRTSNYNHVENNFFTKVGYCVVEIYNCTGNTIVNNICNPSEPEPEPDKVVSFGFWFLLFWTFGVIAITVRYALRVRKKTKN